MKEEKEINKKEFPTNPRIHYSLVKYIRYIIERHKEEYGIQIKFTEASKILADRSEEQRLFK